MQEKAPIFKSGWCNFWNLILFFYTQKVVYFLSNDSSSPVKASNFNPLNPTYLRCIADQTRSKYDQPTLCRSSYDLWRAGSSPTIFHGLKNLSRSPRPLRAGPINPRCILDQHTLSPTKARSLPIRLFFQSGSKWGLIGSLVWTGL